MYILNDVNRNGCKIIFYYRYQREMVTYCHNKGGYGAANPMQVTCRRRILVSVVVVILVVVSSFFSFYLVARLVVLFVVVVLYPQRCHISIVHLEDLVRGIVHLEASCTSMLTSVCTSVCIWDTSYRSRPFANGNRQGIFPGLKTIYKREGSIFANGG